MVAATRSPTWMPLALAGPSGIPARYSPYLASTPAALEGTRAVRVWWAAVATVAAVEAGRVTAGWAA
jgi:hypothetical protein